MTLWILLASLALTSGAFLFFGFGGRRATLTRRDGSVAILTDQLAEVAADRDRGLISGAEAEGAEIEIKRRLLSVARRTEAAPERRGSGRAIGALLAVAVPAAAVLLYLQIGAPEVAGRPSEEIAAQRAEAAQVAALTAELKARLESDPEGGPTEGWVLLGQTYMNMGRYEDAAGAFASMAEREGADSSVQSRYAEALIAAESGVVTPKARRVIDRAIALDSANPAAVFYLSQAREQEGALVTARALLVERLDSADGFQPWMELFIASANRLGEQTGDAPLDLTRYAPMLGGGREPSAADVAAAQDMAPEDRMAFVESMVEGLAARLEDEPGDLDGWIRLMRAYDVLGRTEDAAEARTRARAAVGALPSDDPRRVPALRALDGK
ncbi:c-type cytochrome biogenesis protein CcmI [Jannaschia sp. M317]|uniref:c-type cytochrome biogenesis protein CcmI n=1 Tax=Jannaschia sp. M317 TaxID=2867011 RepID=UPI0021A33597|nr:c-type cytochrome biogenesis protein CcmI [Jannaschia sp. M317]UWQ19759.1 c-type cytochrome biogenesis protein CcmI [Jannaschia sp. M317]